MAAARSFVVFKSCTALYMLVFFYHAGEIEPFVCLVVEDGCKWPHKPNEHLWSWQLGWRLAAVAAVLMLLTKGMARRCFATACLVMWTTWLSRTDLTPPHIAFVSLAVLHLVASPSSRDSAFQDNVPPASRSRALLLLTMHRTALAVANGGSGFAKLLFTPPWRAGTVFESLSSGGTLRNVLLTSPLASAALFRLSPVLCAFTLVVECGAPFVELISVLLPQRGCKLGWLWWWASAALQLGILSMMPLTDVSLGMLLFHAALFDAAQYQTSLQHAHDWRSTPPRPSAASSVELSLLSVLTAALIALFVARPLTCFCDAQPRWPWTSSSMGQPRDVAEIFVKAFLPLPKTTWDSWPCAPGDASVFDTSSAAAAAARRADVPLLSWGDDAGITHVATSQQFLPHGVFESVSSGTVLPGSGGHFWHISILRALDELEEISAPDGLALLLCNCTALGSHYLSRRLQHAIGLKPVDGQQLEWFRFHVPTFWRARRCREDFCERKEAAVSTGGSAIASTGGEAVAPRGEGAITSTGGDVVASTGGDVVTSTGGEIVASTGGEAVLASADEELSCEPWCQHPCSELNGESLRQECGGCDEHYACNNGALGYPRP